MASAPSAVAHVIGRLDVGGAERMLLTRYRAMPREFLSSTAVCLSGRHGLLASEFESNGVSEVLCGVDPFLTFPFRFLLTLRRLHLDVVISHVSLTSGIILLLAKLAGVRRRVAVFHSDGDGKSAGFRRRAYRRLMKALLQFASTDVVGVTTSTLAFSGVRANRRLSTEVIPNAVNMADFSPLDRSSSRRLLGLPESAIVLAHVGRAAAEKNRKLLPQILAAMPSSTVLALAGSTTNNDLDLVPGDPLESRIHNLGLLRDVRPLLGAADVVILPSIREGSPVVILEALSCGRAVVATDLPGVRSIAIGLPDVHLVPAGSSADQFAAAATDTIALARTEDDIRGALDASSLQFGRTLEQWMSLCQPRG